MPSLDASLFGSSLKHSLGGMSALQQSLEAQEELRKSFGERTARLMECLHHKKALRHLLRTQTLRREQIHYVEQRSAEDTQQLLDELAVAVRERMKVMHEEGYQFFVFNNGDVYEGSWKSCRMHGNGVMKRVAANDVYEGGWFLGVRNGTGTCHSLNFGTLYSGGWLAGKWHGHGELVEPEGVYTGEFVDGRIQGYGEYLYNTGYTYKGDWFNGIFEGAGILLCPDGSRYEGQWVNGHESGRGTMSYFNGDVYTGEWRYGRKHGTGIYTAAMLKYDGEWFNGVPHGCGECVYADDSVYKGSWAKGMYHGHGMFSSKGKKRWYKGEFCYGKRCGKGVYFSEEVEYSGEWLNDQKHGVGEIKTRAGGVYYGNWENDVPHGDGVYVLNSERITVTYDRGRCVSPISEEFSRVLSAQLRAATNVSV